jgi:hypothetical protein
MPIYLAFILSFAFAADSFSDGVKALSEKDAPAAIVAFEACASASPARVECHWELGWAHYLQNDWAAVVSAWEQVLALDPQHPEVKVWLTEARDEHTAATKRAKDNLNAPAIARPLPPEGATVRIRAVGDVMLGTTFPNGYLPPDDGRHLLDAVRETLADADLTFINLEGPLCDGGKTNKCKPGSNCYAFRTPTRYGQYLKDAGVDMASVANNHSNDFGTACRKKTTQTLDALGIRWSGDPGTVATIQHGSLLVGMVAFYTHPRTNNLLDISASVALIERVSSQHDITVVSFHGGAEGTKATHVPHKMEKYYGEKRGELRRFSHAVIDAGADLVLGHGPHVLRGMEVYNQRLIAYSLGNFATYGRFSLHGALGVGAILDVTLDNAGRFHTGEVLSTVQHGRGIPALDPAAQAAAIIRQLSASDFPDTGVIISNTGRIAPQ